MNNLKIIGLGGLSESGKSFSGIYLEENYNIKRVKIIKHVEKLRQEMFEDIKIDDFHKMLYENNAMITRYFLSKICLDIVNTYKNESIIVIESLRQPLFGEVLKEVHNNTEFIYFHANFEIRCNRERLKTNKSFDSIISETYDKDRDKIIDGAHNYEFISDYIFDNNGDISELTLFLDKLIKN